MKEIFFDYCNVIFFQLLECDFFMEISSSVIRFSFEKLVTMLVIKSLKMLSEYFQQIEILCLKMASYLFVVSTQEGKNHIE